MGPGITPLATIILSAMRPEQAGAASGALTTMQNVGNALGVAVIGVVFFGALHSGFGHAFELSLAVLAGILAAVVALTRLLPAGTEQRLSTNNEQRLPGASKRLEQMAAAR
jgi:MFS family permease